MRDTQSILDIITGAYGKALPARNMENARSVAVALQQFGGSAGLLVPHRLAQYLAQLAHESAGFRYDREVWGPTAAQLRYEDRADLGNTQPGDGRKFAGHGPIQVTGRYNHRKYTQWSRKVFPGRAVPDFEQSPELINTDPWEGLTGIWYWDAGNPEGRSLNRYADSGDVEMITRRINGGLNGYKDRIEWLVRFSLVMLGYRAGDVAAAQRALGLEKVDGIAGPKTRAALHRALVRLGGPGKAVSPDVRDAPVVAEKPVVPEKVDTEVRKQTGLWGWLMTIGGGAFSGVAALLNANWQTILALGVVSVIGIAVLTLLAPRLAHSIRQVREAVEGN